MANTLSDDYIGKEGISGFITKENGKVYGITTISFCILFFLFLLLNEPWAKENFDLHTSNMETINKNRTHDIDSIKQIKQDTLTISSFYNYMIWREEKRYDKYLNEVMLRLLLFLVVSAIITFFIYRLSKNNISFYCFHCLKAIFPSTLKNLICPSCNGKSNSFFSLISGSCRCKTKLKWFRCPHCKEEINLFKEYDHKKIKSKIYAS